jgi:hypothetical protein
MTMIAEIATLKFKLDPNPLPFSGLDLTLRLAIGEARLNCLHQEAKLTSYHPEQEYHTVLIHGLVSQPAKIDGISIGRTALQYGGLVSA